MKVKIGNTIYDAEDQPVMIILSDEDKENISNMPETNTKYCCFPCSGYTEKEIEDFMNVGDCVELEKI